MNFKKVFKKLHLHSDRKILKPQDHYLRCTFGDQDKNQLQVDPIFYQQMFFGDEAYF